MKKQLFFLALIIFFLPSFSQQKKNVKPEIDRLAEKYKNDSVITIFSSGVEFECEVNVNYNSDNKPEKVSIIGHDNNKDNITELLANLIAQKMKQGYKPSDIDSSLAFDKSNISVSIPSLTNGDSTEKTYKYYKGNLIFEVKVVSFKVLYKNDYIYIFSISTIDNNRVGGHKATELDI